MILRILAEAEAEIDAASRYLDDKSSGLGGRFLRDLQDQLDAVAADPNRFPKVEPLPGDHSYRRARLNVFRYVIVFRIVGNEVFVVAIAHGSREPNYWLGRPI